MRELMARTVFWKSRFWPLRRVPRRTLSCLEGTQALAPFGDTDGELAAQGPEALGLGTEGLVQGNELGADVPRIRGRVGVVELP